jgi:hypothetical protein
MPCFLWARLETATIRMRATWQLRHEKNRGSETLPPKKLAIRRLQRERGPTTFMARSYENQGSELEQALATFGPSTPQLSLPMYWYMYSPRV